MSLLVLTALVVLRLLSPSLSTVLTWALALIVCQTGHNEKHEVMSLIIISQLVVLTFYAAGFKLCKVARDGNRYSDIPYDMQQYALNAARYTTRRTKC